jgi:GNAT superfamily N-acetyltransferase
MIQLLVESLDLKFVDTVSDAYKSETYGTIYAYLNDKVVGYVDYTLEENDKIFYIRMIQTEPEYRGKGIATTLCRYIKNNYSEYEPDFGATTTDGEKLRKQVSKTIPNNFYGHIKSTIDKMQNRLNEIEHTLDDLYAKSETDESNELTKAIIDLGDEWEELHDKIWEYEQKLQDIKPFKTVWTI